MTLRCVCPSLQCPARPDASCLQALGRLAVPPPASALKKLPSLQGAAEWIPLAASSIDGRFTCLLQLEQEQEEVGHSVSSVSLARAVGVGPLKMSVAVVDSVQNGPEETHRQ